MYQQANETAETIKPQQPYYIDLEGCLYCRDKKFAIQYAVKVGSKVKETDFENFSYKIEYVVQKDHKSESKSKIKLLELTEQEIELRKGFKKLIDDKYKSLSSFAAQHSFDKSDLSKFLKGQKDWQLNKFCRLNAALKTEITVHEEETPTKGRLSRYNFKLQFDPQFWHKFMTSLKINRK